MVTEESTRQAELAKTDSLKLYADGLVLVEDKYPSFPSVRCGRQGTTGKKSWKTVSGGKVQAIAGYGKKGQDTRNTVSTAKETQRLFSTPGLWGPRIDRSGQDERHKCQIETD